MCACWLCDGPLGCHSIFAPLQLVKEFCAQLDVGKSASVERMTLAVLTKKSFSPIPQPNEQ